MHQIYSYCDENLEVFTTVFSSKACTAARQKQEKTKPLKTKTVVAVHDYHPHWVDELLLSQGDIIQVLYADDELWWFGCQQNGQRGFFPSTCVTQHREHPEPKNSRSYSRQMNGLPLTEPAVCKAVKKKSSIFERLHASTVAQNPVKLASIPQPVADVNTFPEGQSKKGPGNTEEDAALALGPDAAFPLTGSLSHGTPSILRKILMKPKKKPECIGATNCAFEAD